MVLFNDCRIAFPDTIVAGALLTHGSSIAGIWIGEAPNGVPERAKVVNCHGLILAPGLIDLHNHGGLTHDFVAADAEGNNQALRFHCEHGVTSLLATKIICCQPVSMGSTAGRQPPEHSAPYRFGNFFMSPPPAAPQPSSDVEVEHCQWFKREVHPHGGQLESYLRKSFPCVRDVEDVVQESYLRIWKAQATQPIRSAKAFLYEVARRLAIDKTRRQARSPIDAIPDFPALAVIEDRPGIAETVSTAEDVALLARALEALPSRCREVMILRQLEGRSQKEIAVRLGLSDLTVQTHVVQGLRRMRTFFRRHGTTSRQDL